MPSGRRGTNYNEIARRLAFAPDGRPVRRVGSWTRDKLALLAYYLPEFARLCSEKADGWYYLDGFAGNGVNETADFPLAKGTALIGVTVTPPAEKAVLIEARAANAHVLRQRCASYGNRATVLQGDCNQLAASALEHFANRSLPAFCMLDPEGLELDWSTITTCATRRTAGTPYELLIYFSTPGTSRASAVRHEDYVGANRSRLTRLFGNNTWLEVAEQASADMLQPGEAGQRYLDLYRAQLESLGYKVQARPALRHSGRLVYHLVFASANAAAHNIMRSGLARAYASQIPLQFPPG